MTEVAPPVRRRLSDDAIEHLHSLMAGWQLIADLAFADLLLFLAVEGSESFRIVGQLRPYTARTLYRPTWSGRWSSRPGTRTSSGPGGRAGASARWSRS